MTQKVWVEVALNGAWTRGPQPHIPITAAEIVEDAVACVKAGAAVIHAHTLDPDTGRQNMDPDNCQAFIEGIREQVDAIVYPTAVAIPMPENWEQRYATTVELAKRGCLEWGVLDPGSCNFAMLDSRSSLFGSEGDVYVNPPGALKTGIDLAAKHNWHPAYACYEPGFVREGAKIFREQPAAPVPVFRFMFTNGFTFCFPPEDWALEAMVKLVARECPGAPWMAAGLSVDVLPLIPRIVELGGHIRVGLEDAPFGSTRRNVEWVEAAVAAIQKAGAEPATASEIRAALAAYRRPERLAS